MQDKVLTTLAHASIRLTQAWNRLFNVDQMIACMLDIVLLDTSATILFFIMPAGHPAIIAVFYLAYICIVFFSVFLGQIWFNQTPGMALSGRKTFTRSYEQDLWRGLLLSAGILIHLSVFWYIFVGLGWDLSRAFVIAGVPFVLISGTQRITLLTTGKFSGTSFGLLKCHNHALPVLAMMTWLVIIILGRGILYGNMAPLF